MPARKIRNKRKTRLSIKKEFKTLIKIDLSVTKLTKNNGRASVYSVCQTGM